MARSALSTDTPDFRVALSDVSSAAYAETQVVKALGRLKRFSSHVEISGEAQLSERRAQFAIGRLAANRVLEASPPGTGKLWRLSAEGLDMLKRINAAERILRR
jgi:hypothetical protein